MTTMPIVDVEMDHRAPSVRLARLLDPGSAVPLHADDDSGVQAVCGRVDGAVVVAYCTDATRMGGALGGAGAERVVEAIGAAERLGCPVIGLWHSGGARLADGVESMHGVGRMFAAMTRVSGVIPQISVVLGPAAGAAAYGPALTDIVIMAEDARIFITGPEIVRSVTGERIDMAGLGGPEAHGPKSGVAHLVAGGEDEAYEQARRLTGVFARPGNFDLGALAEGRDLAAILPDSPRRAYDVRPLVRSIVDEGFLELQPRWASNVLVGLGRLGGRSVGVLANNPIRKGGCLDTLSAEKASRFVRMCDALGVPLVVVVDVPGYLPGIAQEWDGVVRRGAKLLHAFAESVVPRVTLITRKAYGGAYIAMNSRSLGASAVFAWPDAEVAVMGAESAVGVLHRKALAAVPDDERADLKARLTQEHLRVSGGVGRALALGVVDEVISPETTRLRLAEALNRAPCRRGRHGNIPL
ncbi:acyl-CoA carboxylase subunit beta [Herbidospora galbida]|uniref:Acyl-CoA carboxylase subunit beta n=1 Tax=Herbidospora galbida TaxID=2575442 RepID=A0A4U3M578_9ACTN|nr:carboxyl transferase domain-containing protein [Herbidospora galbida]TKK84025.1 acyl-CoA carboxylase subunit beta [Herbidospora galbida]